MADFKKLTVWQKARELTVATIVACDEMSGTTATLGSREYCRRKRKAK
jgi:hypothetical protein